MLRIWVYCKQKGAIKLKKNTALAGFCQRFQAILEDLDAFEMDETLEELNAQFEDALFLMESIDPEDADAAEETEGALEELDGLLEEYRDFARQRAELAPKLDEMEMALKMARMNLL